MFLVNEKSATATGDVILKALKNTLVTKKGPWRFRLFSTFPWLDRGDEFMCHNRGVEKCREDKKIVQPFQFFLFPVKWLFVLWVTRSYESDNEWEDQLGWSNDETQKNDEEQVFRTDPASKYSVLHTVEIIPGDNDV